MSNLQSAIFFYKSLSIKKFIGKSKYLVLLLKFRFRLKISCVGQLQLKLYLHKARLYAELFSIHAPFMLQCQPAQYLLNHLGRRYFFCTNARPRTSFLIYKLCLIFILFITFVNLIRRFIIHRNFCLAVLCMLAQDS